MLTIAKAIVFRYNKDNNGYIGKGGSTVDFFKKYSYNIFKLFLTQIALALMGMAMALAFGYAENRGLQVGSSIFVTAFYLFLLYVNVWEVGAKDGLKAAAHGTSRGLWRGFVMALVANALNLILAFLILPGAFLPEGHPFNGFSAAVSVVALMIEGMYQGILAVPFRGLQLHDFAWVYFAIVAPAVLVCGFAYILGSYQLHATNLLIAKNKDVKNNGRPE